jgi:hypothetical protein
MAKDKEVIVTGNGRHSGATVAVIAVVLLIALGLLFLYFGTSLLRGSGTHDINADVKVETPAAK